MVEPGDNDQLLHSGKYRVTQSAKILCHPYQSRRDAGSQSSSHWTDNYKQQE